MTTKQDAIAYFKTAPRAEVAVTLEIGAAILEMRPDETKMTAPRKPGRPAGSRSKKKPAADGAVENFSMA